MTMTPERSATLSALVAAEIRAWLGRLDVRPAELARRLGENDQWLSTRLKGRTPINLNDLQRIADALELGVADLLPPKASRPAGRRSVAADLNASSRQLIPSAEGRTVSTPKPNVRTHRHVITGASPFSGGRRDATRPVSAIPASRRRPTLTGPGVRPIDR